MKPVPRTITSATVTITVELPDLGTFGPGSLFAQAKFAAAHRLTDLLGIEVSPEHLRVEAISTEEGAGSSKIEACRYDCRKSAKLL